MTNVRSPEDARAAPRADAPPTAGRDDVRRLAADVVATTLDAVARTICVALSCERAGLESRGEQQVVHERREAQRLPLDDLEVRADGVGAQVRPDPT